MTRGLLLWLAEPETPLPTLQAARSAGLDAVLLRRPGASAQAMREGALRVEQAGLRAIVNDRLDVALAIGSPCQLRHDSLPPHLARRVAPFLALGCSVHDQDEAQRALDAKADYLVFGHVFETSSKPGLPPQGLAALAAIIEGTPLPVLAIGGITAQNAADVLAAGASGLVVRSAISRENPGADVLELRRAMDEGPVPPQRSVRKLRGMLACACA